MAFSLSLKALKCLDSHPVVNSKVILFEKVVFRIWKYFSSFLAAPLYDNSELFAFDFLIFQKKFQNIIYFRWGSNSKRFQ